MHTLILSLPIRVAALDAALQRWLCRGSLQHMSTPAEPLEGILAALNQAIPQGLAALRLAGQTGVITNRWVAGADPVYLEPMLDHLRVRCPSPHPDHDAVGRIFAELNRRLGDDGVEFFCHDGAGYLVGADLGDTPRLSASAIEGMEPSQFMPSANAAANFHRLLSEIQMVIHDLAGPGDINALWVWGGGVATRPGVTTLPTLYSGDPLIRGFWQAAGLAPEAATDSIGDIAGAVSGDAVVTVHGDPVSQLLDARQALRRRTLNELRLLFADGNDVLVRRSHAWRFWRRPAFGVNHES